MSKKTVNCDEFKRQRLADPEICKEYNNLVMGIIEQAEVKCWACEGKFMYKVENRWQGCPHCGQKNYKASIFMRR